MMETGFILINKPEDITSHDVIDALRRITKIRKIGHAGTLDPFATGLLICGIGRESTKRLFSFLKKDKEYIGRLKLGFTSDTYDKDGKIEQRKVCSRPRLIEIEKILQKFKGEIDQRPPMFSAKKMGGKKLYQLARKGIDIDVPFQKVNIHNIEVLDYDFPDLEIKVNCSSGTYIRSLANDIGEELGCGAYLEKLCRTKIGGILLEQAKELKDLTPENWRKGMVLSFPL